MLDDRFSIEHQNKHDGESRNRCQVHYHALVEAAMVESKWPSSNDVQYLLRSLPESSLSNSSKSASEASTTFGSCCAAVLLSAGDQTHAFFTPPTNFPYLQPERSRSSHACIMKYGAQVPHGLFHYIRYQQHCKHFAFYEHPCGPCMTTTHAHQEEAYWMSA